MSLISQHQPVGDGRQQEPQQHRELAVAGDAATVLGPEDQLGRRRRRRLRDQPEPGGPGQRPQSGHAEQPGRRFACADGSGLAQRRRADASACPRARGAVRQRHDLEADKEAITSEVTQLSSEIERVGETTQFNGIDLLSKATTISFQVGANDGEVIGVKTADLNDIASKGRSNSKAPNRSQDIDEAIDKVSALAGEFGCRAGSHPVHRVEPGNLQPEPVFGCEWHHRREHGGGNDQLHEAAGSRAGRRVDSLAGQRGTSGCPEAAAVVRSLPQRWRLEDATAAAKLT